MGPATIEILEKKTDFDVKDSRLPASSCNTCRTVFHKAAKNGDNDKLNSMFPDYSQFTLPKRTSQINTKKRCDCNLCELVRSKGDAKFKKKGVKANNNPKASITIKKNSVRLSVSLMK